MNTVTSYPELEKIYTWYREKYILYLSFSSDRLFSLCPQPKPIWSGVKSTMSLDEYKVIAVFYNNWHCLSPKSLNLTNSSLEERVLPPGCAVFDGSAWWGQVRPGTMNMTSFPTNVSRRRSTQLTYFLLCFWTMKRRVIPRCEPRKRSGNVLQKLLREVRVLT